jgi:hypothetical protein
MTRLRLRPHSLGRPALTILMLGAALSPLFLWRLLCAWAKAWLTGAVGSMPSEAELSAMIAALLAEDDLFDVA